MCVCLCPSLRPSVCPSGWMDAYMGSDDAEVKGRPVIGRLLVQATVLTTSKMWVG